MAIRKSKYSILILFLLFSSKVFALNYYQELLENNPVYKKAMSSVNSCYAKAGLFRTENLPHFFINLNPTYQANNEFKTNHLIFSNVVGLNYSLNDIINFNLSASNLIPFNVYYNEPENEFRPSISSSLSFPFFIFSQNILQAKRNYSSYTLQKQYAFLFEQFQTRKVLLETVDAILSYFICAEKDKVFSEIIILYKQKAIDDYTLFEKGLLSLEELTENDQTLNNYQDTNFNTKIELNFLKEKLLTFGFSTESFKSSTDSSQVNTEYFLFSLDSFIDYWFAEAPSFSLQTDTSLELEEISEKINIATIADDYLETVPTLSTSTNYSFENKNFSASLSVSIPFMQTEDFYYYDKIVKCSLEEGRYNDQERKIKRNNLLNSRSSKEKLFKQILDSKEEAHSLEIMKTEKAKSLLLSGQLNEFDLALQKLNQTLAQIEVYVAKKQIITSFLQNF